MGRKKKTGPDYWPALDRDLYVNARGGSRRSGRRQYWRLSPTTIHGVEVNYTTCLKWLEAQSLLAPDTLPADRWPLDVVEGMAEDMMIEGCSVASVRTRVARLKRALGVMQPDRNLDYFDVLLREFDQPKPRFDPIVWKITSADLRNFGVELMQSAAVVFAGDAVAVAARFCAGLQIALIAARPWRRRVFTLMQLYEHLVRVGDSWRMQARSHETKHRRYQSGQVPRDRVADLETYLGIHRPALCALSGYTGAAVWINERGQPMTPQQFSRVFARLTTDKFKERVTVHAVRKIAATTMAVHNPSKVHDVQATLGHLQYSTGERHYILANTMQAHKDLDATIDALARAARDRRRLARRKPPGSEEIQE